MNTLVICKYSNSWGLGSELSKSYIDDTKSSLFDFGMTEDRVVTQWVIHPLGRFSQKTKEKSVQGPPLARMMSLSDKEIKSLAITQEISNVSSSLLT